jgi:hypothetical protein
MRSRRGASTGQHTRLRTSITERRAEVSTVDAAARKNRSCRAGGLTPMRSSPIRSPTGTSPLLTIRPYCNGIWEILPSSTPLMTVGEEIISCFKGVGSARPRCVHQQAPDSGQCPGDNGKETGLLVPAECRPVPYQLGPSHRGPLYRARASPSFLLCTPWSGSSCGCLCPRGGCQWSTLEPRSCAALRPAAATRLLPWSAADADRRRMTALPEIPRVER